MLYVQAVHEDFPSIETNPSVQNCSNPHVADDRDLSQPWGRAAVRIEWPAKDDRSDPDEEAGSDLRIFRPEVYDAVWPRIIGARAALARDVLTPEMWRRCWLNGYALLRTCDPARYAATASGLEQTVAVLAPVIRRVEADLREAGGGSPLCRCPAHDRRPPSSATLGRWLREEAEMQLPTGLPRRVSEMPIGSPLRFAGQMHF